MTAAHLPTGGPANRHGRIRCVVRIDKITPDTSVWLD
jgi:hypothetical protein